MKNDARIAVLYPWTGLPAQDRGAARRVVPLVEMLAEQFSRVTVLSPGDTAPRIDGNIEYRFHHPTPGEATLGRWAFRLFDGLTWHAWNRQVDIRHRRQWWHYLQPRLQQSLHDAIRQAAGEADVVLLEYPFWSALLPAGKPVILTMHDVLSDMIDHPRLRRIVQSHEMTGCRKASAIVCVSEPDRQRVREWGFDPLFIPHGFQLHPAGAPPARAKDGLVCLFVGSSLQPNRDAVEFVKALAPQVETGISFVIAGACHGKANLGGNITSLGPVSESELADLYDQAGVVLAPVFSGTGSSTKVLEAFSREKVLVASTTGVRGYDIVNGREAIIADDLAEYPAILSRLRADAGERTRLATAGRKFVEAFDSRRVYQPYADTISRLLA